jgi:IclR family transcriptional regulator, KDG regulon repressor
MIQSVARALDILGAIKRSPNEQAGLMDIARELNLDKTTVFNLLKTLRAKGVVSQRHQGSAYRLGSRLFELAKGNLTLEKIQELLTPLCKELQNKTGVNVSLSTVTGGIMISPISIHSKRMLNVTPPSEEKVIYTTSCGRCLLTRLPRKTLQKIIKIYGFPGKFWNDINNFSELQHEVEKLREQRVIKVISDCREVIAFCASIDTPDWIAPLAIGIYLPIYHFKDNEEKHLTDLLLEYATRMSTLLEENFQ